MTTLSLNEMLKIVEQHDITVTWDLNHPTQRGGWLYEQRLIRLNPRLTTPQATFTLAHELTHATLEHKGEQSSRIERLVDMKAALLIIDPTDYALTERIYGPDPRILARELDTIPRAIKAYQQALKEKITATPTPTRVNATPAPQ